MSKGVKLKTKTIEKANFLVSTMKYQLFYEQINRFNFMPIVFMIV